MAEIKANKPKILCLHGFSQNPKKFAGHVSKLLKGYDLTFVDGFFKLPDGLHAHWVYSEKDSHIISKKDIEEILESKREFIGLDETLKHVKTIIDQKGPFDGVFGFSQGAVLAAILCDRMDEMKINFKFAILVSGFWCKFVTSKKIKIKSLHVLGLNDEVIPNKCTRELADVFENSVIFEHEKKHVIPTTSPLKKILEEFMKGLNFI